MADHRITVQIKQEPSEATGVQAPPVPPRGRGGRPRKADSEKKPKSQKNKKPEVQAPLATMSNNAVQYYELYRRCSVGTALTDTLDDLISQRRIEPQLAIKLVATFDRVIAEVLAEKVKSRMSFKGHLDTYRFCDDVWTFIIKDVSLKMDNSATIQADKLKIVAMNSKRPGEA